MEGFMTKKGSGLSFIGRRNWKRRWFHLDENRVVSYYKTYNTNTNKPISLLGSFSLEGCIIEPLAHHERNFAITITSKKGKILIHCDDEQSLHAWTYAIEDAINNSISYRSLQECYELLNLDYDNKPSRSEVNKAYRSSSLDASPDKGEDIIKYKMIQEAFTKIMLFMEEEDLKQDNVYLQYDITILKHPKGVGFGVFIKEDPITKFITVKDVNPDINLNVTYSDKGIIDKNINVGDRLIGIGSDKITGWNIGRILQRINNHRVPVNSYVQMSFLRKLSKEDYARNCNSINNQLHMKNEYDSIIANNTTNVDDENKDDLKNKISNNNNNKQLSKLDENDDDDDDENENENNDDNNDENKNKDLNIQKQELKLKQLNQLELNENKITGDELTKYSQKMTHISNYVKNNQKLNYSSEIDDYLARIGYNQYQDSNNIIKRKSLISAAYIYGNSSILNKWENSDDNILNKIKRLDRLISSN